MPTAAGAVTVHVGRAGGGSATVLLHGAAGSSSTWTPLIAAAERAAAPLADVVAIDMPGWGDSGRRVPTIAALSSAVVEVVRALGYESWRLVGHSLGGVVALDIAARFPRQTSAVGLVSPSGGAVLDAVRRPVRGGLRLPGFAGMLLAMRLLRALGDATPVLLRMLRVSGLLRLLSRPLFRRPARVERWVTDALAEEIRPSAFVRAARAARGYDEDRWRRITCPVRAIAGEHDVFARPSDREWFARRIRSFHQVRVADAGHFAHIEAPLETLRALALSGPARDDDATGRVGVELFAAR